VLIELLSLFTVTSLFEASEVSIRIQDRPTPMTLQVSPRGGLGTDLFKFLRPFKDATHPRFRNCLAVSH
jgi:hypothetical protein